MSFLIRQTLIYAVPLMLAALAGVFAERSGIVNLALEGMMIFGAFVGVLFVTILSDIGVIESIHPLFLMGIIMLLCAFSGFLFSLLLSFASVNLRANQTVTGISLNMLSPALVLFLINLITNQNVLTPSGADITELFMLKKSTLGLDSSRYYGFFAEAFIFKGFPADYICIALFIAFSLVLYKSRFGLRLRACGENPHAAASLGISVEKMRYLGTGISGALSCISGFVYVLTTANCSCSGDVAGFGFLALAVMIFGAWKPLPIVLTSLVFGVFKCIAAAYSTLDLNGDGRYLLAEAGISTGFYRMLPYLVTLIALTVMPKASRPPAASGIPYNKSER